MINEAKNRHVVIHEWMLDFDLSPTELICYAIIFGFSQDGKSKFQGSASYLSKWTKTSRATIFNALKKLCDMNLIAKEEKVINGVKLCDYRVVQNFDTLSKIDTGVIKNLDGGYQNFCLHNIEDNIEDNNTPYNPPKGEKANTSSVLANTVKELFNTICVSLPKVQLMNASRISHVKNRLKEAEVAPKDCEAYLRKFFASVEASDFLTNRNGDNRQNWKASFDWLFLPRNFLKVSEGNYTNKQSLKFDKAPAGWLGTYMKIYQTGKLPSSWDELTQDKKENIINFGKR